MASRSYLFVPADRPERIGKALASGADAVIVDLEDAVATASKLAARSSLAAWLDAATSRVLVRINGVDTDWCSDDLALCRHPGVSGVMVPKAERSEDLSRVASITGKATLALIETAAGIDSVRALAAAPGVERLAFGSIDFQLDLGIDGDGEELLSFRSQIVLASRLAERVAPLDGVSTAIDDIAQVEADAARARRLGFGGKLCIHPGQVGIVNRCFRPTEEERSWAMRVVEAASRSGGAVVAVDGRMVDRPVILRARRILDE